MFPSTPTFTLTLFIILHMFLNRVSQKSQPPVIFFINRDKDIIFWYINNTILLSTNFLHLPTTVVPTLLNRCTVIILLKKSSYYHYLHCDEKYRSQLVTKAHFGARQSFPRTNLLCALNTIKWVTFVTSSKIYYLFTN
jgi:hypothetical protein